MGQITRTETPPLIRQDDHGQWIIELTLAGGQDVVQAEIGDGAWLLQQIVEKIVLPRLRVAADTDRGKHPAGLRWPNAGSDD